MDQFLTSSWTSHGSMTYKIVAPFKSSRPSLTSCFAAKTSKFSTHLYFVEKLSVLESLGPHLLLQVVLPDLVHLEHLEVGDGGRQDPALVVLDVFCQLVEPENR